LAYVFPKFVVVGLLISEKKSAENGPLKNGPSQIDEPQ